MVEIMFTFAWFLFLLLATFAFDLVQNVPVESPKNLEHFEILSKHGPLSEDDLGVTFDKIGTLEIRLSKIKMLSKEILQSFTNLENLTISFSQIEKTDKDIFSNCCPKLKILEIKDWQEFDEDDLKGIGTLPLERLEIMDQNIPTLKSGTFQGTNLKSLVLIRDKIEEIEEGAFTGLDKLEHLQINNNKIKDIRKQTLAPLKNLETLELSSNEIEKFSTDNLPDLPNLTDIVFIRENLKEVNFEGVHKVAPKLSNVFIIRKNPVHVVNVSDSLRIHMWQ